MIGIVFNQSSLFQSISTLNSISYQFPLSYVGFYYVSPRDNTLKLAWGNGTEDNFNQAQDVFKLVDKKVNYG
jgi:hypothetical protein